MNIAGTTTVGAAWRRVLLRVSIGILLLSGCSDAAKEAAKGGRKGPATTSGTLAVVFLLPGDDIGSPERAAALERIRASLTAADVGEIVSSGFGMGTMELVVRLRDGRSAASLEEAARAAYPGARYRLEER